VEVAKGVDHFGEEVFIVGVDVGHAWDTDPVADDSDEASAVDANRVVTVVLHEGFVEVKIDAFFGVLEAREVVFFPTGTIFEGVIDFGVDRVEAGFVEFDGSAGVEGFDHAVGERFDDFGFKRGKEIGIGAPGLEVDFEAEAFPDEGVELFGSVFYVLEVSGGEAAFGQPFVGGFLPDAEMDYGEAVVGLVVEDGVEAFAVCHLDLRFEIGCREC